MIAQARWAIRAALAFAALAAACAIGGCNERGESAAIGDDAECSVRVIVRLAAEADGALLADLERTNALELEPLETITRDLRVYTLRAAGSDDDCVAALERLRRDGRVRSVDIDARRELHEQ